MIVCAICGEAVDPWAEQAEQAIVYLIRREGGGPNRRKPEPTGRVAHADCVEGGQARLIPDPPPPRRDPDRE